MKKLLLLAGAALAMSLGACADSSTAPTRKVAPSDQAKHDDFFCESGYVIAYDENGNPYCVPENSGSNGSSSTPP